MKVMTADDSAFMRKVLVKSLKSAGIEDIVQAESGEEAVEKFKSEDPDLIFLDIVMGGMSGIDALKEIKKEDPNVNAVMCSAVGQEQMVEDAKDAGASDFIDKPFQEEEVKEIVEKFS